MAKIRKDIFFNSSTIRNLYGHCIQSEEGQHVGCVTDRMGDGSYLTGKTELVEEFPTWADIIEKSFVTLFRVFVIVYSLPHF